MPPIEIGPTRPVGAVKLKTLTADPALTPASTPASAPASTTPAAANSAPSAAAAPKVETSDAVKGGDAPIDAERVQTIRRAIQEGRYPILPTKIADAMIAAGMLLRSPQ